ncbi:MAG: ABC transporter permease [Clostridia bacterium]|nr:ABC transporter permease [Clostridia bacterium]
MTRPETVPAPRRKRRGVVQTIAAAPHALWCVLFILAPMAFVVYYAFTDADGAFTIYNINEVFSASYLRILERSILYALVATAICLVLAYPLAYAITKMKARHQPQIIMLLMLPMWINLLIRTYSLKILLETNGVINHALAWVHLGPVHFLNSNFAIILGMVYNYLPYMVLPIYSVLVKIDRRLIEAAQDLGCNSRQVLGRVTFPLSLSGVISGITMVFVPSISTFFISKSLSDGRVKLIGDVIETEISMHNVAAYNIGSALSFVLMVLILVSLFVTNKFGEKDGGVIV